MTTPLVHTPEVHDAVWEAYDGVLAQRRTRQLAAVLRLNEDESAFEVRRQPAVSQKAPNVPLLLSCLRPCRLRISPSSHFPAYFPSFLHTFTDRLAN